MPLRTIFLAKAIARIKLVFPLAFAPKMKAPLSIRLLLHVAMCPLCLVIFPATMLNSVNPLNDKKFSTENLISIKPPPIYIICDFFTFSNATKKFITTFWVLVAVNNLRLKFHKKSLTTRFWKDSKIDSD